MRLQRKIRNLLRMVVPIYAKHDGGHRIDHALSVLMEATKLAGLLDISKKDLQLLQAAAILHDVALIDGRDTHHIGAHDYVLSESAPSEVQTFSYEDRLIIATLCLEHRASTNSCSSTLSSVLSAADRGAPDLDLHISRSIAYCKLMNDSVTDTEALAEASQHMREKYGRHGYAVMGYPEFYKELYATELEDMWQRIDALP